MYLPDPRLYPRVNPQNPVIRALMSYLTETDAAAAAGKHDALAQQVRELLATHDHYALNGALTQAPSQEAYKALWQVLRNEVETPPAGAASWAVPFVLPIVLVAGARGQTTLPGRVDGDAVLALLRQHGVIAPDAECRLSGALVHPGDLAAVNPATLADWRDPAQAEAIGRVVREAPVSFKDEGVFLRFLVGSAIQQRDAAPAIRLGGQVGAWGMPLAQAIGDALKLDGLTLFAIPRVPQSWLAAQEAARVTHLETRLQVAASNALRSIRSKGRTPVATIAAHEGGEIRITFSSLEDAERWEGFVWPLAPLDSAEHVRDFADALFRECQLDDIRVIDTVQPDKDGELPFFVTAHYLPKPHH
ncbi:hypothetical protein GCM10007860_22820 [Chitiniphilus shinanonensis]|uniref:Uncharacterized protein n=1 Tax=Chitiniphilus shinanonensis TaxID=553088 RepID=A0ABQ6BUU5_9NEIS|nr:hypothetical protein [Chitiniphilus shinanonensis]GLS05132.1 hypothetical protein GCM10007860_22820 [Chitiniphilus shinanonensis]